MSQSSSEPLRESSYGAVVLLSLVFLWFLFQALEMFRGRVDILGVYYLRNFLGYGHFTLAYIFTWPVVRRKCGSLGASLLYVAGFLAVMSLYCAAQRWWLPASVDILLILTIFMVHHASNEVLFREHSKNGYQAFPWTPRRVAWVALAVGLIFVDRFSSPQKLFLSYQPLAPVMSMLWIVGWLAYGWRYVWRSRFSTAHVGWIVAGVFGTWCAMNRSGEPVFTSTARYGWFVIYHYLIWYVFYTQKLLYKAESQIVPARPLPELWRYVTTVPRGFVLFVLAINLIVGVLFFTTDPLARTVNQATQLNFFYVHTLAHILFGVGLPKQAPLAQ